MNEAVVTKWPTTYQPCSVCSKRVKIRGTRKNGVFCSADCRQKSNVEVCGSCGKQYRKRDERQSACSRECSGILKGVTVPTSCCWCDRKLTKGKSRSERAAKDYCSKECHDRNVKLRGSMRLIQKQYSGFLRDTYEMNLVLRCGLNPKAHSQIDISWAKWCLSNWRLEQQEETDQSMWMKRLRSAVQVNKYRDSVSVKQLPNREGKCLTWMQFCKGEIASQKLKMNASSKRQWINWLHNRVRSQALRMRRKTVQSQQSDCIGS